MAIVAVFGLLEMCYDLAVLVLDDWGLIELYSFILRRQMQTSLAVIHILLIDGVKSAAATHHHQICHSLLHLHAVSTVANNPNNGVSIHFRTDLNVAALLSTIDK